MNLVFAVVLSVAFVAVDARAWFLAHDNGIEGLWVAMHLFVLGGSAGIVWTTWMVDREFRATKRKGERGTR